MDRIITTTPVGNIELSLANNCLLGLTFTDKNPTPSIQISPTALALIDQLSQYFADGTYEFNFPLNLVGTPFQLRVWKALQEIPAGTTLTYGELGAKLNTSPRAIGNACRTNPIAIIVPCHRVVGQKGLTGYYGQTSGEGIKTKSFLLDHECAIYS